MLLQTPRYSMQVALEGAGQMSSFRGILKEFGPLKLLVARMQEAVLVALTIGLGWIGRSDPFLIFSVAAACGFGSFYSLEKAKNRRAGQILVALLILLSAGLLGWTAWSKMEEAEDYQLVMIKNMMERDIGTVGPDGKLVIRWAHWRIDVHNPNDFSIYASFQRRFGSIKGDDGKVVSTALDTDAEERADIEEIKAHTSMTCGSDRMDTQLSLGRTYSGDFSCIIKYGREKGDLKKTFDWTRKPIVTLCPYSNNVCDIGWN